VYEESHANNIDETV